MAFYILPRRRVISCINLELAFPELSFAERYQLNREHFISMGRALFDLGLSWWGSETQLKSLAQIEGIEYLEQAIEAGGVLLLSAHFTSLEIGGRIIGHKFPLHGIYRPHQNPVVEWRISRLRERHCEKAISRDNIREMIRSLQQHYTVWYAQDQNFGHKNSVFAPFFNVPAATNTATSRLAKLGKAKVVPFFTVRTECGYLLRILPPLDNFPTDSLVDDTARINHIIEQQVREYPAQYLWTHRRYKDMPEGGNRYDLYPKDSPCKSLQTPSSP
jgi:KDO2-lipid IV(A) lauroyltransferase